MAEQKKIEWKAGNMLYPLPAVMVSCGSKPEEYNIITISWVGTINSEPPMLSISVRPERYSYDIIKRNMAFVVNLPNEKLGPATDFNGVKSGRDFDKFKETGLSPVPARKVSSVLIGEAPLSIECEVKQILPLGSHDMFIAEVVNVVADKKYFEEKTGRFRLDKAKLFNYMHGQYYAVGKKLGRFGHSVQKKKKKRK